jgi:hypothetical protein
MYATPSPGGSSSGVVSGEVMAMGNARRRYRSD